MMNLYSGLEDNLNRKSRKCAQRGIFREQKQADRIVDAFQ